MADVDRLLRHWEEVTEEVQALKHRLSYLEDYRKELHERILGLVQPASLFTPLTLGPPSPAPKKMRHRPADFLGLRQAADALARIGGEVDARLLSKEMGISFDAARLRLARAARQGLLVRVKLGKYRAIDPDVDQRNGTVHQIEGQKS